jgi:predicted N-acetyltransferase YhbS
MESYGAQHDRHEPQEFATTSPPHALNSAAPSRASGYPNSAFLREPRFGPRGHPTQSHSEKYSIMCGTLALEDTQPEDHAAIEHLLDLSFGSDRFSKTSYKLRDGNHPIPGLSLVVRDAGVGLSGTISFWPIRIGANDRPALLLGPLAVHPDRQNLGIGLALMREGLARAMALGHGLVLLVGDEPYYARVGFRRLPAGLVTLPGPVNPDRFLYLELKPGALAGVSGLAQAPVSAAFAVPHGAEGEQQRAQA